MSSALETAKHRFTSKVYDAGKPISDELWREFLEICRLTPSSVNYQPVRFLSAETEEARARIAGCAAEFNKPRLTDASHALVLTVPLAPAEAHFDAVLRQEIADGRFAGHENEPGLDAGRRHYVGLHTVTPGEFIEWCSKQAYLAAGYLTAAAAEMGFGCTLMEGIDFAALDRELKLRDEGVCSVLVIAFGTTSPEDRNAGKPKSRLPFEERIRKI